MRRTRRDLFFEIISFAYFECIWLTIKCVFFGSHAAAEPSSCLDICISIYIYIYILEAYAIPPTPSAAVVSVTANSNGHQFLSSAQLVERGVMQLWFSVPDVISNRSRTAHSRLIAFDQTGVNVCACVCVCLCVWVCVCVFEGSLPSQDRLRACVPLCGPGCTTCIRDAQKVCVCVRVCVRLFYYQISFCSVVFQWGCWFHVC